MATNARNPPQPSSNGVITAPPKGLTGANRKKQKRRAKQHARTVSSDPQLPAPPAGPRDYEEDPLRYAEEEYDEEYSDTDAQHYHDQYIPPHTSQNGFAMPPPSKNRKKNNKKKRTSHHDVYSPELLGSGVPPLPTPPPPSTSTSAAALRTMHKSVANHPNIWNTSTQQERQNIKDFWLSLSEDARKSLLKIEKEAVLRKMKQQQKHSCSCTVCGRKRTAIEEELEVLYEGYYEELEQYAHHDHPPLSTDGMLPEPLQHRRPPHPLAAPPPNPHHRSSQMLEHLDEEEEISEDEEYSDEEEEEDEEDDEEEEDEEEYSDEEPEPPRGPVPDFFNFGQNLTVKDNLLTVADDLLKNDGRKFIEMMEQLAERRMQRESEAEYAAANPSHPSAYPPNDPAYNHEDPLAPGDEYDDEEASYDSQEEYDDDLEEEDEMGGLTEEQRMQEGRRMFQIFAARMFEQRVLTAYKEKVAAERQQKLLEELQDEEKQEAEREAKKKRDAEKKKEKKRQQQLAKAEEKALKEAKKKADEAEAREAEEEKQKEQKRKKEEQRKKKEEERRKHEEERVRKEAEKHRRQVEEQQRREEAERKAREQRAAEKAKKEEARKREREERESREKEAKERKAQEEKERKEREAKSKADREARERERNSRQTSQQHQPQHSQIAKRPSQAGMVAVPGVHPKQTASGISSPHPAVATPVIPKAPTPARQKQPSQQGSHTSSPRQSQSQLSSAPSKSSSPGSNGPQQPQQNGVKSFMQKGPQQQGPYPPHQMNSHLHHQPIQPPPGMQHAQQFQGGFGGMPPLGFQAFQGPQGPMMHNMGQRGPVPMYGHQGPPMGVPNRMSPFGPPGMNGMPGPPPGMMHPQGRGMGFPFDQPGAGAPPGFGPQLPPQQPNQTSPLGPPLSNGTPGTDIPKSAVPVHSRQHSSDNAGVGQPIARPAPIQRPGSIRSPGDGGISPRADVDDLSKHLGSSALLDDSDEPILQGENRRMSHNIPPPSTRSQSLGIGGLMQPPGGGLGTPATSWNTPSLPFGQSPGLGQQQWGSLPNASHMTGWANNNAFGGNGAFGPMVGGPMPMQMHRASVFGGQQSRPLTLRLAICQACKQLSGASDPSSGADGFHDIHALMRQMPALDPPPSLKEVEEICETEGDSQNGGGELSARKAAAGGDVVAVKWTPDSGTPKDQGRGSHAGLGEIGSPMPSKRSPAGIGFGGGAPAAAGGIGAGRPSGGFASLGAVGSPSF